MARTYLEKCINFKNVKIMNKSFKLILCVSLIGALTQSCNKGGPWGIRGTGTNVTETKDITGFDKLDLSIDADIFYTQDSIYKVEISAQQNILAVLKTEVNRSTLSFDYRRNVWDHNKVKITIHSPNLNELNISGSGDITVQNSLTAQTLDLNISGSGNVYLPSLTAQTLKATISGNGDVKISGGSLTSESFHVSGSGTIDAENIQTESCTLKVSGSGDITVNVTESLDVHISGSGDVRYRGKPSVTSDISGSGRLIHLD